MRIQELNVNEPLMMHRKDIDYPENRRFLLAAGTSTRAKPDCAACAGYGVQMARPVFGFTCGSGEADKQCYIETAQAGNHREAKIEMCLSVADEAVVVLIVCESSQERRASRNGRSI